MSRLVPGPSPAILTAAFSSLLFFAAPVQNRIAELQSQFKRESDPVRKAKTLTKLGDAQLELARRETDAGHADRALQLIEEYRDEAKIAEAALKASGLDAERQPAGFKQLQIHVRKSVREIEQTIQALPDEERPPFEVIRQELMHIDKELVDLLFPRQPGKSANQEKKKG
ncbi:MAG TPA: hypothetical protein VHM88_02345 [Candidatus Acidoferrales bacterium]|nr:hypothetical protein [Candidatus Acidoferrales bacterium]